MDLAKYPLYKSKGLLTFTKVEKTIFFVLKRFNSETGELEIAEKGEFLLEQLANQKKLLQDQIAILDQLVKDLSAV